MQNFAVWVYAFHAKDPVPVDPPIGLRVALLTTIVPSKEPIDVVERTLRKMLRGRATAARSTSGSSTRATTPRSRRWQGGSA